MVTLIHTMTFSNNDLEVISSAAVNQQHLPDLGHHGTQRRNRKTTMGAKPGRNHERDGAGCV